MARLTLALVTSTAAAWYLPGIAVHDYEPGEQVWLKINSLTSPKTQIPYEYYKFNFCRPRKIVDVKENFGEFLSGDRIQNSPYKVFALEDTYCNVLCATKTGGVDKAAKFADLVADNYHHNWILDNLPAAAVSEAAGSTTTTYSKGIPVGYAKKGKTFVHNHVTLIIKYHATADGNARIVGLYAEPFSVKHKFADGAGWTYNPTKKQRAKGLKVGAKANDGARLATCDAYPTEKGSCPST
jgi:transmembrane 9 superfamily protein 2/4